MGIIFDQDLRFRSHIYDCISKGFNILRILYQHRELFNQHIKKTLCDSLVLSKLNYCDSLYGPCLDYNTSVKIQRLQNTCLRFIYGIRKFDRISHKLKEAKWLNMSDRRLFHTVCLYQRIIVNKCPTYLYKKISFRTDVHTLNLRFKGLLTPPIRHTEFFKRSFSYTVAYHYNITIPSSLKKVSTFTSFKRKFRELLLMNR